MVRALPYLAGLDLGSTRTRVVIATPVPDRTRWAVVGYAEVPSKGIRKGVVVSIEQAEETIRQCLTEAEKMAGFEIDTIHASLSGLHVRGLNGHGVVTVSQRNRQITAADIQRVIEQASAINLPSDRGIVEVLPQEFVVDEQDGIGDPLGMLGMRLEVTVHIVTSPLTASQNIVTSANRLGIIVEDLTLGSLAAATATLTEEEREYGTAIIDIGGEITSLAVFQHGAVRPPPCLASVAPISPMTLRLGCVHRFLKPNVSSKPSDALLHRFYILTSGRNNLNFPVLEDVYGRSRDRCSARCFSHGQRRFSNKFKRIFRRQVLKKNCPADWF